ncbi:MULTISPECIES: PspC domain-containing protein [unclassified Streptosporangium]|uniref:PspC domain-containing protein n=1 Tax=unclassified Streptosporangium TaxID=2632669 RepID=UPI002E28CDCE|nr:MULTISPECIES: PspC domain-containing protein [unclassified Streptosporangium]
MNDTGRAQDPASSPSASSPFEERFEERFSERFEERGLRRSNEGRMLTGVCAGLGRYARIDPVVLRVGFAVLVLGSGIGIMLYIAAFLLMRETDGSPGYLEQWIRRDFDSETVLTLLTGLFALGLIVNVSSDGIGTGTVVVGTVFAIALLAAHSRGVDLLAVARSLPDRLRRRRAPSPAAGQWPGSAAHPSDAAGRRPVDERDPFAHTTAPSAAGPAAYAGSPMAGPTSEGAAHAAARPGAETVTEPYAPAAEAGPGSTTIQPSPAPGPQAGHAPGMPPGPAAPPEGAPRDAPGSYRTAARPLFNSSGEPFSPYGPYQPLDPQRRQGPYPPYDPSAYGGTVVAPPRPRRRRSLVGSITICLAMIVGGIIVAIQSASGSVNMTVVGGAVLVVIGAGLLVATWFGRGAGLVATGTVLSIALVAGSTLGGMPKKFGDFNWRPATLSEVARSYSVGVGEGRLDLGDLVLPPGSRTIVDVSVSVGEVSVILPATARIEVNGSTRFGDIKIDHVVEGGADIEHSKILEPEVPPKGDVATIVLNIKAGIGDVEVRRAA